MSIEITVQVDLPLPTLARRAVERVMATMMSRTGDRFAENLYRELRIPSPSPLSRDDEVGPPTATTRPR